MSTMTPQTPHQSPEDPHPSPRTPGAQGPSRRSLLRLGAAGAGAGAALGAAAGPASAAPVPPAPPAAPDGAGRRRGEPDPDSPRFTIAVMPDTQYLFDATSLHPQPIATTVDWVIDHVGEDNIVFFAHLGDVVQNAAAPEVAAASPAFDALDASALPWSVLAGNHDIDSSTDDQRGPTSFLSAFGPSRFAATPGYSADPGGYNSAHLFRAGGRQWLLLALDWRVSDAGLAWAASVLAAHPTTPTIVTIHELVNADGDGTSAYLSDFGQHVWDTFIAGHDQVFLTLNGHFWPPGRTTLTNAAGNPVHAHLTNYQDRYYGGAAMIRLYRFDLERAVVDVSTINPWFSSTPYEALNELAREGIELTDDQDRFSIALDPAVRFAGFAPVAPRAARTPAEVTVAGTVGLWGWLDPADDGQVLTGGLPDLTRRGNDLAIAGRPGSRPDALVVSAEHHRDSPSKASLRFQGGKAVGDYLATAAGAPLNTTQALGGYTIEAFFKLAGDWGGDQAWSALLSRAGSAGDAGKRGGYSTAEPVATLSLSNLVEVQWNAYPVDQQGSLTSWSHLLPLDTWFHVAVVNDGAMTRLYIDGCEEVRNPTSPPAHGIATLDRPWLLGGQENGGAITTVHAGWIGDVRIVDRALKPSQFLIA